MGVFNTSEGSRIINKMSVRNPLPEDYNLLTCSSNTLISGVIPNQIKKLLL
jgi:hypothetical protein